MECRVCTAQPSIRTAVESLLSEGKGYRQAAKQSGFSKSALFRHMKFHVPRRVLKQSRDAKGAARFSRVVTRRIDGSLFVQKTGQAISESELLASDVIIAIQFTQGEVGNPDALLRTPPGLTIEELEAHFKNRNRKPPEPSPADDPLPLPIAARAIEQRAEESQQEQSSTPVEPDCEHDFKTPSAGVHRCQKCGWQKPTPKLLAANFGDLKKRTPPLRSLRRLNRFLRPAQKNRIRPSEPST